MLDCLISELARFGAARLLSEPIKVSQSRFERVGRRRVRLSLHTEMMGPIQWDSLADCIVAFGDAGVQVRCGSGHHLFWLSVPGLEAVHLLPIVERIAKPHELVYDELDWTVLL